MKQFKKRPGFEASLKRAIQDDPVYIYFVPEAQLRPQEQNKCSQITTSS